MPQYQAYGSGTRNGMGGRWGRDVPNVTCSYTNLLGAPLLVAQTAKQSMHRFLRCDCCLDALYCEMFTFALMYVTHYLNNVWQQAARVRLAGCEQLMKRLLSLVSTRVNDARAEQTPAEAWHRESVQNNAVS